MSRAFVGIGAGMLMTNNLTSGSATWSSQGSVGIEEMVCTGPVAPPQSQRYTPTWTTNTGIDIAKLASADVVRTGYMPNNSTYTTNRGSTWTSFPTEPSGASSNAGAIAISANGATIIWTPGSGNQYYSTIRGSSWTAVLFHLGKLDLYPQKSL